MNSLETSIKEFPEEVVKLKGLKLKKEIPVRIRSFGLFKQKIFTIENQIFEIRGEGISLELAQLSFITRFIQKYDQIQSFPDLKIKHLFDEYIEEVKFLYNQDSCGRYVKEETKKI